MAGLLSAAVAGAIREALLADGLTQAEFARRVGASEKHVSRVLTGQAGATLETLNLWGAALGRDWIVTLIRWDQA